MIHVIALDITFGIPLNFLNIKSHSKVVKYFLQLYHNPGDPRGLAVSLAASTPPEAVRMSGGCRGLQPQPILAHISVPRVKNV